MSTAIASADDFKAKALPVAGATFLSMLGVGMLVPALPRLAADAGSTALAAGALIGAYGFARLLCNTPSGYLTDRIGIARSARSGLLALAAVSVFAYFADHFIALLLAMAVQGAASSLFSTAAMTSLVLLAGPQARGRGLAWFQSALLLGFAVGPMIGGFLVDLYGAHAPFAIQAAVALLALTAVGAMQKSPVAVAPGAAKSAAATLGVARPVAAMSGATPAPTLASLLSPALIVGGLCGFAAFFARFGVAWNVVPIAALGQFQLSNSMLGWIIGVGTLANLAITPLLGRLVDGWGAKPTFLCASLLNVGGMLALFLAPSLPMLWVATAVVLLATGTMIPAAGALALTNAKPQVMGRTMGLFRTVGEAGMAFGPVVVPALSAAAGLPVLAGLLTCSAVTAIAMVAAALLRRAQP